jgi:hypothetical protein
MGRLSMNWDLGDSPEESLARLKRKLRGQHPEADRIIREIEQRIDGLEGKEWRAKPEPKSRLVYRIFDPARRLMYVGLTFNLTNRLTNHRRRGTVGVKALLAGAHSVEVMSPQMLPEAEAQALETSLIRRYRLEGWEVLNLNPGGGLGGAIHCCPGDLLVAAQHCTNRRQFQQFYPTLYDAAIRSGLIEDAFALHRLWGWSHQPLRAWPHIVAAARAFPDYLTFVQQCPDLDDCVRSLLRIGKLRREVWPGVARERGEQAKLAAIRKARSLNRRE